MARRKSDPYNEYKSGPGFQIIPNLPMDVDPKTRPKPFEALSAAEQQEQVNQTLREIHQTLPKMERFLLNTTLIRLAWTARREGVELPAELAVAIAKKQIAPSLDEQVEMSL